MFPGELLSYIAEIPIKARVLIILSSRTRADTARQLGWKPKRSPDDFQTHFVDEWKAVIEADKKSDRRFEVW